MQASRLSPEVKENTRFVHRYNATRVAIATGDLAEANQQDPYNLYRQGQAYAGKGDRAKTEEMFARAVGFNQLPTINSALMRMKARKHKA